MSERQKNFAICGQRITRISSDLEIEPVKKRTVRKQSYRSNPPIEDIEAYYRITYYYAFLDHAISHLKTRFSQELEGALIATYLLPGNISNLSDEIIDQIRVEFAVYLPHQSSLGHEISTWKIHIAEAEGGTKDLLSMCNFALKRRMFYPNIYTILVLLLSLPVGSCSCKRSFSALKRLKTWCRSSMTNERLDSLALGYINHERSPPEEVLQVWDGSCHRRIALAFQSVDCWLLNSI